MVCDYLNYLFGVFSFRLPNYYKCVFVDKLHNNLHLKIKRYILFTKQEYGNA